MSESTCENRLLLPDCRLTGEPNRLLEDRHCPADCDDTTLPAMPFAAVEHSAAVDVGSTFCCCSVNRERRDRERRVTGRCSPPDDDCDMELMSAKSPDDGDDCTDRPGDTGLHASS